MCLGRGGPRGVLKPDLELALPKHGSRGRATNMSPWVRAGSSSWSRKAFQGGLTGASSPGRDRSWDGEVGGSAHQGTAWGLGGRGQGHDQMGVGGME